MAKGISVFIGMENSIEDNLSYISRSHSNGFSKIFTSLHIPEANYKRIISEFGQVVELANSLNMSITADISPNAYQYLSIYPDDLSSFKNAGLSGIRLDYGFKPDVIAKYSNNDVGLKIELNASTMTEHFMDEIVSYNPNLANLSACHNYYPRCNTGISIQSLISKGNIFRKYSIPVSAFVSLNENRRGPLYDGLPTLEVTRNFIPMVTWQLLSLLGIDNIFIGDSLANEITLQSLQFTEDVILLPCISFDVGTDYMKLLEIVHTNRPDSAEDVIRSQESRLCLLENLNLGRNISPENCIAREAGDITVDNINYLRYSGEMQICKRHLPADDKVNVIGRLHPDALVLLDYIGDNQKFKLFRL